jgi:hypothetical protein
VLPEDLFPAVGLIAAYVVKPIIGDYVRAITLVSAGVLSCFITLYALLFKNAILKKFSLPGWVCNSIMFLFLLFHFLMFKDNEANNIFLFGSPNLNCVFNYLIPALLNAGIVLYFWQHDISGSFSVKDNLGKASIMFFMLYLAIFSNVLQNIILVSYVVVCLVMKLNRNIFHLLSAKKYLYENKFFIGILAVWFIALIFEANGGRSDQIGASLWQLPFSQVWETLTSVLKHTNRSFLIVSVLIVIIAMLSSFLCKNKGMNEIRLHRSMLLFFMAGVLSAVYLFILCAKANPTYIGRGDVLIGIVFWLFLLVALSGAYVLKRYGKSLLIVPLLMFVLIVEVLAGSGSYMIATTGQIAPAVCAEIDRDIINQVIAADKAGKKEMILVVPKGDNIDNWPHPLYMNRNFSRLLYWHGIISKPIQITMQPDVEMNSKYHIPVL